MKINNNKNQQQGEKKKEMHFLTADNDLNKKRVKHTIVTTN